MQYTIKYVNFKYLKSLSFRISKLKDISGVTDNKQTCISSQTLPQIPLVCLITHKQLNLMFVIAMFGVARKHTFSSLPKRFMINPTQFGTDIVIFRPLCRSAE